MTTSSTYAFAPDIGELVIYAFNLCGIRPTVQVAKGISGASPQ